MGMKKKYFVIVGISLLLLSIIIIVSVMKQNKSEKPEIEESVCVSEEQIKEMERKKEELIRLCEENKEEIGEISKEFLEMMKEPGKSLQDLYGDFVEMNAKIEHPKWQILNQSIRMYYPVYEWGFDGVIYYRVWYKSPFILDLVYIDTDSEKILEYVIPRIGDDGFNGEIIEINEQLYVYLREAIRE